MAGRHDRALEVIRQELVIITGSGGMSGGEAADLHQQIDRAAAGGPPAAKSVLESNSPLVPQPPAGDQPEPAAADVRAWAQAQGIDVPARGKLSAELIERYKALRRRAGDKAEA